MIIMEHEKKAVAALAELYGEPIDEARRVVELLAVRHNVSVPVLCAAATSLHCDDLPDEAMLTALASTAAAADDGFNVLAKTPATEEWRRMTRSSMRGKRRWYCRKALGILDDLDDLAGRISNYRKHRQEHGDPIGGLAHRIRIESEEAASLRRQLKRHAKSCPLCGGIR